MGLFSKKKPEPEPEPDSIMEEINAYDKAFEECKKAKEEDAAKFFMKMRNQTIQKVRNDKTDVVEWDVEWDDKLKRWVKKPR